MPNGASPAALEVKRQARRVARSVNAPFAKLVRADAKVKKALGLAKSANQRSRVAINRADQALDLAESREPRSEGVAGPDAR